MDLRQDTSKMTMARLVICLKSYAIFELLMENIHQIYGYHIYLIISLRKIFDFMG